MCYVLQLTINSLLDLMLSNSIPHPTEVYPQVIDALPMIESYNIHLGRQMDSLQTKPDYVRSP